MFSLSWEILSTLKCLLWQDVLRICSLVELPLVHNPLHHQFSSLFMKLGGDGHHCWLKTGSVPPQTSGDIILWPRPYKESSGDVVSNQCWYSIESDIDEMDITASLAHHPAMTITSSQLAWYMIFWWQSDHHHQCCVRSNGGEELFTTDATFDLIVMTWSSLAMQNIWSGSNEELINAGAMFDPVVMT